MKKVNVSSLVKIRYFILVVIFMVSGCNGKPKELSIPLPLNYDQTVNKDKVSIYSSIPPTAAIITDISGTMDNYTDNIVNDITNNLQKLWIPSLVVKRNNEHKRYSIDNDHTYWLGSDIIQKGKSLSRGFKNYTSLQKGYEKIAKLLDPQDPKVGMVLMISDLETEIDPNSKNCPKGNAPFCVAEQLRPLFQSNGLKPGWWALGLRTKYKIHNKVIWRPIFINIIGYEIEPIRILLSKILENNKKDDISSDNTQFEFHLLEITHPVELIDNETKGWNPRGKIRFFNKAPFIWFKKEQSFKYADVKDGKIVFEIDSNYLTNDSSRIETPLRISFQIESKSSLPKEYTLSNFKTENKMFKFNLKIPRHLIKGTRKNPDLIQLILSISLSSDLMSLAWINEWSKREDGNQDYSRIANLKELIEGIIQVSMPETKKINSGPIKLLFWK